MKLFVNNWAIIFLDIDRINNYRTIAYNWETDDVIAIRPKEYLLLRHIWERNGLEESATRNYHSQYIHSQEEAAFVVKKLLEKNLLIRRKAPLLAKNG